MDHLRPSLALLRRVIIMRAVDASLRATCAEAQTLPTCPTVNVSLRATIDTKVAKSGDVFRFKTLVPATSGTQTIAAGTPGPGLIEVLDHSKSNGHPGYLVLNAIPCTCRRHARARRVRSRHRRPLVRRRPRRIE